MQQFFVVLIWIAILSSPLLLLHSCYKSLNLCGRQEITSQIEEQFFNEVQQALMDYTYEREQIFEKMYQLKIQQDCQSHENPQRCFLQKTQESRKNDRIQFNDAIKVKYLNANLPIQEAKFYVEQLNQLTTFKINTQYELFMEEIFPKLQEIEDKYIHKTELTERELDRELSFDMKLAFSFTLSQYLRIKLVSIESKGSVIDTFWGSEKTCSAELYVNRQILENHTLYYQSETRQYVPKGVDGLTKETAYGYIADLQKIQTPKMTLTTAPQRINFFMRYGVEQLMKHR